jgi:molybdate transport system substrate-binding protein
VRQVHSPSTHVPREAVTSRTSSDRVLDRAPLASREAPALASLVALALSFLLAAPIAAASPSPPVSPGTMAGPEAEQPVPSGLQSDGLTIFAAASLADVLEDLEVTWLGEFPEAPLTVAFDASNVLAAQIAEGADVDVFLSADLSRPAELAEAGLTSGEPVTFAHNSPVIVVPLDSQAVMTAMDLAEPGIRLVAAGTGVPITRYAEEAIAQLAATTPDPAAFASAVAANVVSREDNVRAALAKVELGEGDAAIVYATDVRTSDAVREVPFPEAVQVSAEYGAVQVSDDPAAAAFVIWLTGSAAQTVLAEAAFQPADG